MTGKAAVYFGVGRGAKNEHSHSDVRLFAMKRYAKRHAGLPVGLCGDTTLALILIEKETTPKLPKPSKRYGTALDDDFRAKILNC